jgi:phytanoyl-CoA hydroxylase
MRNARNKVMDNKEEHRRRAEQVLQELKEEAVTAVAQSWIGGGATTTTTTTTTTTAADDVPPGSESGPHANFFHHAGFVHIPSFCSLQECEQMKLEMADLVRDRWKVGMDAPVESFGTDDQQNTKRGDYFLDSSNAVHFFAEPSALNADGTLQDTYHHPNNNQNNKMDALNKVGHALHLLPGSSFHSYCFSSKIKHLVTSLGWIDPVVPQSMYIFKGRQTGGIVTSHQDSTFLYTEPHQTCLGLWLALDAATLDNGCLWIRPKSHVEPVRRHFQRNVEHFGESAIVGRANECSGDPSLPKLSMVPLLGGSDQISKNGTTEEEEKIINVPWEGSVPADLGRAGFIPLECQAGDLLAFCGTTDHLSLANESDVSRHTFQLHLIDRASSAWSRLNWLQYPTEQSFASL